MSTNNKELKERFVKWLRGETTFALGVPDDSSIADWWLDEIASEKQRLVEDIKKHGAKWQTMISGERYIKLDDAITLIQHHE